ncbi:MAG TPA: hypothetical protein VNO30_15435 [Kofleriaceae bacterium]|nr:hypothetical protein [Kofleriaceae bacterium]
MRALTVVSLLVLTAPALADTPPPAAAPAPAEPAATPAPAEPEAAPAETEPPPSTPVIPPALVRPSVEPAAPEDDAPRQQHSYRWQIVGPDAAVVVLSLAIDRLRANDNSRPDAIATLAIASYFFTAPLIHGAHRQGKRALISFGLRAGLPLLLGLAGEQLDGTPACDICEDSLRSEGKLIGITAGVLIAMAVDGTWLGQPIHRRTERKPQAAGPAARDRPRAAWAPQIAGVRGGATAGVVGTF